MMTATCRQSASAATSATLPIEPTFYMRTLPQMLPALDSAADEIRRSGVSLDEVACLARCAGADVALHRPDPDSSGGGSGVERFRADVIESATRDDTPVLIVNYSRRTLGQTGDGHFSPSGGYHAATDRVLVLDTARFKYSPHWVPVDGLFAAMQAEDVETGQPRGWLRLRAATRRRGRR